MNLDHVSDRRDRHWSPAEDRRLMFLRESGWRLEALGRRMGRTPLACSRRAKKLGLGGGTPHGYESIEAAATRTTYCPKTLRRIFRFAAVPTFEVMSEPFAERKGRYRCRYVDPVDVDEAIALWVKTESVAVAARARGLSDDTLRRWLRETGRIGGACTESRFQQRVESTVIDAIVAAKRAAIGDETSREQKRRAAFIRWERHPEQRSAA